MEFLYTNKVIVLVDMDCFYCQVEEKLNPNLIGKPIAVVQYNAWRGGGIIAVNYPAKDKGVTRHMRGNEAKAKCPDINLVRVPTLREKADLTKYRDAGKEVAAVLQTYANVLERASVDEAYLDITDTVNNRIKNGYTITIDQLKNTHVIGCNVKDFINNFKDEHYLESNLKLCIGGIIAEEIRAAVLKETGYKCSAGIAHNKILAKLACGLHKPNQQTILPQDGVNELFKTLPLGKIKSLGGKFGSNLSENLGIKTMGELKNFSEKDLINRYDEKTGKWLYRIARGIDLEPVTERLVSKSIGCCKKFPGRTALVQPEDVHHWINQLSVEISERLHKDLEENNRKAKQIVVGFVQKIVNKEVSTSRTHSLNSYEPEKIAADMLKIINKHCLNDNGYYHLTYLGVSAGKFEDCKKAYDITSFFKNSDKEFSINKTKSEDNSTIDYLKANKVIITNDTTVIQMDNKPIISDNKFLICNNEAGNSSMQEWNFMTNIDLNKPLANYSHCNEDDILDTNDNYLNEPELSMSNVSNVSKINEGKSKDITDTDFISHEIEDAEISNSNSFFSQNTDILEIDEAQLVFNEDYKNTDEFYIRFPASNEDSRSAETDSITDEIESGYEERHKEVQQNTSSYFSNYFNNKEYFNRNFDTSRYLRDDFESESSSTDNYEQNADSTSCEDCNLKRPCESPDIPEMSKYVKENVNPNISVTEMELCPNTNEFFTGTPGSSSHSKYVNFESNPTNINYAKPFEEAFIDNTKERCEECNKLVPKMEMTSHMDYHYAIKIVRDEAHLYNSENSISAPTSPKKVKQTKRRKFDSTSNTLTSYLETNKEIPSDVSTEICPDCNKRIMKTEFLSHLDYHVAKKLHSEMNSVANSNVKTTPVVKGTSKKKQTLKQNKHQSVMSFFKQNM